MSDVSQIAASAGDTGLTIFLSFPFIRPTGPALLALAVGTLYIFAAARTPSDAFIALFFKL